MLFRDELSERISPRERCPSAKQTALCARKEFELSFAQPYALHEVAHGDNAVGFCFVRYV